MATIVKSTSVQVPTVYCCNHQTGNGINISYQRYSVDYEFDKGRQTKRSHTMDQLNGLVMNCKTYIASSTGLEYSIRTEQFHKGLNCAVDCDEQEAFQNQVFKPGRRKKKENKIEVTLIPPSFDVGLKSISVKDGDVVKFKCHVISYPRPKINWYRNGSQFATEQYNDVFTEQAEDGWCELVMAEVFPEDQGVYLCEAINPAGRSTTQADLVVESYTYIPDVEEASMSMDTSQSMSRSGPAKTSMDETLNEIPSIDEVDPVVSGSDIDGLVSPPRIIMPLRPVAVDEGDTAELNCRVASSSPYEICWFKDNELISQSDDVDILSYLDGTQKLILQEVFPDDDGIYTCRIINEFGPLITQCRLTVEVDEIPFDGDHEDSAESPERAGGAGPTVRWQDRAAIRWTNSRPLSDRSQSGGSSYRSANDPGAPLPGILKCPKNTDIVMPKTKQDKASPTPGLGKPQANEVDKCEQARTSPIDDTDQNEAYGYAPEFVQRLEPIIASEGDNVKLKAVISGYPVPDVRWFVDGDEIRSSRDFKIMFDDGIAILNITQVYLEDEGEYCCKTKNKFGHAMTTCYLSVSGKARSEDIVEYLQPADLSSSSPDLPIQEPKFIQPLQDVYLDAGRTARLKCIVSGYPLPTISWFHNSSLIPTDDKDVATVYEDGVCLLLIRDLSPKHEGEYLCEAENGIGKVTGTACRLTIKTKGPLVTDL